MEPWELPGRPEPALPLQSGLGARYPSVQQVGCPLCSADRNSFLHLIILTFPLASLFFWRVTNSASITTLSWYVKPLKLMVGLRSCQLWMSSLKGKWMQMKHFNLLWSNVICSSVISILKHVHDKQRQLLLLEQKLKQFTSKNHFLKWVLMCFIHYRVFLIPLMVSKI